MANSNSEPQARKKHMSAAQKLNDDLHISQIDLLLEELNQDAGISEKDLISYLDISEKTLNNWKNHRSQEPVKASRIFLIKEVVDNAKKHEIPKSRIKQLLNSPIESDNEDESNSLVEVIREEKKSNLLVAYIRLAVEHFASSLRVTSGEEIRLTKAEFENLTQNLKNPKAPSESLIAARQRYLKSRIVR